MEIEYYKDGDILVLKLSRVPYEYAEMQGSIIVHYSKDRKPVRIEILNASRFLKEESTALPRKIKEKIPASA